MAEYLCMDGDFYGSFLRLELAKSNWVKVLDPISGVVTSQYELRNFRVTRSRGQYVVPLLFASERNFTLQDLSRALSCAISRHFPQWVSQPLVLADWLEDHLDARCELIRAVYQPTISWLEYPTGDTVRDGTLCRLIGRPQLV